MEKKPPENAALVSIYKNKANELAGKILNQLYGHNKIVQKAGMLKAIMHMLNDSAGGKNDVLKNDIQSLIESLEEYKAHVDKVIFKKKNRIIIK